VPWIEEVLGHDSAPWPLECRRGHTAKAIGVVAREYTADVVVVASRGEESGIPLARPPLELLVNASSQS
jgi:hypothetical protein